MRLSVKGIQKYTDHRVYYEYPIETLKFEPDDFEGAVVLTVEEAEALMTFFNTMKPQMPNGGCVEYCDLWGNTIKERIEQAEKKNA